MTTNIGPLPNAVVWWGFPPPPIWNVRMLFYGLTFATHTRAHVHVIVSVRVHVPT